MFKSHKTPATELESLIKKQVFSVLNTQALKSDFVATIKELNTSRPAINESMARTKQIEIEKTESEIEQLTKLLMTNSTAARLESLVKKLEESEQKLAALKRDKEVLQLRADSEKSNVIDLDYVLKSLNSLRSESFRKANLSKKREILRNTVKNIHISPENVIKVDFWGSDKQSEAAREASKGQNGVVLPFRKLGKPLQASFEGLEGGDKMVEIKKATGIGLYLGLLHI